MIKQFVVNTKTDKIVALSYLSKHDWNVGAAFESFNKDNKIKSIYIHCQLFTTFFVSRLFATLCKKQKHFSSQIALFLDLCK